MHRIKVNKSTMGIYGIMKQNAASSFVIRSTSEDESHKIPIGFVTKKLLN